MRKTSAERVKCCRKRKRANEQNAKRQERFREEQSSSFRKAKNDFNFRNEVSIREEALRCVTQFRDVTVSGNKALRQAILEVREVMKADLETAAYIINPRSYVQCCSCGHEFLPNEIIQPSVSTVSKWNVLLKHEFYVNDCIVSESQYYKYCRNCCTSLRNGNLPLGASCRGWPFKNSVPSCLSNLNKYEALLIPLRLPCIRVWQLNRYGQNVSTGVPISFTNPVANLAKRLPWKATVMFHTYLSNGRSITVDVEKIRRALLWLRTNNPYYKDIEISEDCLNDIRDFQRVQENRLRKQSSSSGQKNTNAETAILEAFSKGVQGPIDGEALHYLRESSDVGTFEADPMNDVLTRIKHMRSPFRFRRQDMIPSWDAEQYLETYFPVLSPCGSGGPKEIQRSLFMWTRHALGLRSSRFAACIDFIFFVNAILRSQRLNNLSTFSFMRDSVSFELLKIRRSLSMQSGNDDTMSVNHIDRLLQTGALNASFEKIRGTPAFWASLKRKSWAYLTRFGPCQISLTMWMADVHDPFVFMQIDRTLTFESARNLSSLQRSKRLAENPVAATTIFQKRVDVMMKSFLFGKTRPFGRLIAYLGRSERQERKSPHLHILPWLEKTVPLRTDDEEHDKEEIAKYVELFCTALLPPNKPYTYETLEKPSQQFPIPIYKRGSPSELSYVTPKERHNVLSSSICSTTMDGTSESNCELRDLTFSTQIHDCETHARYCSPSGKQCRFLMPFPFQERGSVARLWYLYALHSTPQNHDHEINREFYIHGHVYFIFYFPCFLTIFLVTLL